MLKAILASKSEHKKESEKFRPIIRDCSGSHNDRESNSDCGP